ncbi:adenylyltransferase/cytidyltransferase family protein [Nocardioides sp. Kera G14]|uniref:adenylyltransferase/cytidyltransferase family protein n=1 Tax=Nocardioides sp. Kera G14 TaxID=2884264 RepID=UPI001D10F308|nr:adenylyltransferase/cytidyltransferase family protein [Nocardioides sp. Kera G14]UDY23014.1 adenylyltransferase/cytidyltransferase family protein [Nocardioides sp. Kera G14]
MSDSTGAQSGKIIGYVPGVFDLFHVGHLNMLRQARSRCDVLVAGVVSDEMCELGKGIRPTVPLEEREAIVDAIGIVDATYVETSLDKRDAWRDVQFHRLFKGDDWKGTPKGAKLEAEMAEVGVEVCYFPYSIQTSSTALRQHLKRAAEAAS